ncbi:MAG TPA: DNA polymerase III subunit delta [Ferruginibacter sp.]|jgi:DNA polymerase-3 subunit delta|nr:DNA polymerase III subunit delta [Ferruginibacter sp.]MBN8700979.1 DNA polymerase III subunit delta [Chitinophagales bacterium]HNN71861.1 DNA polymerase III subunit delta [Ferruginibacter sp.]HQR01312.1 DNA polymerase III subunit delta [Ferruginibacter sp.]
MSAEKIISEWKKKKFKPVYWLEGEEDYYIDRVVDHAEHHILDESQAGFNLTVFYGRDADWASVVNACRRYPMFAEFQVVLLKEAQQMKDIDKLEGYIENPLPSTLFVVAYKGKSYDKRTKLYKLLKSNAEIFSSEKIRDYKLAEWIGELLQAKGFKMNSKAISLVEEHIGNDLSRIANEIDKLALNLKGRKEITEDDIEQYIGISKEYNVFELQAAIAKKDLARAITIIQYFEGNPKAGPIQMVLPALYASFSKVYTVFGMNDRSEAALKPHFYFNAVAVKNALETINNYGYEGIERILLLLHQYNLKGVGIDNAGTSDASLMKEMVVKMIA